MAVIFNKEGLKDLTPPCVVQQFVNHNAVLFKVINKICFRVLILRLAKVTMQCKHKRHKQSQLDGYL